MRLRQASHSALTILLGGSAWVLLSGCLDATAEQDVFGSEQSPIYGGSLDTAHEAVMALLRLDQLDATQDTSGSCTGTTIAIKQGMGIFLTAAHCVAAAKREGVVDVPIRVQDPATFGILPGIDWTASYDVSRIFPVIDMVIHPDFDGSVDSPADVALVRFWGATETTPIIPVLALEDDDLATGSNVTLVGYGETEQTDGNTERRTVARTIHSITPSRLSYDQGDGKGTCRGDSGGPLLYMSAAGERVAGITTYGDVRCQSTGVAIRVSSIASFMKAFLDSAPPAATCDDCQRGSVAPDQPCWNQYADCRDQFSECWLYQACAAACRSPQCLETCRSAHPAGAVASGGLKACRCGGACQTTCAATPSCGVGPSLPDDGGTTSVERPLPTHDAGNDGCSLWPSVEAGPSALIICGTAGLIGSRRRRRSR